MRGARGQRGSRGSRGGIGGGSAPFNPLTEPDLVGLWDPANASDDGSTLTIANSKPGGAAITSTGAGRATVGATALDGKPGITTTGMGQLLTAAIGAALNGKTAVTVLIAAVESGATVGSFLFRYGTIAANDFWLRTNTPTAGRLDWQRPTALGNTRFQTEMNSEPLDYVKVVCCRFDITRASGEQLAPTSDGRTLPGTLTDPGNSGGTIPSKTLYIGSSNTVANIFSGVIGPIAIIARELSGAEVATWTTYLRGLAGTTPARDFLWIGDSITACSTVGGAQWRKRVQDNYDARTDGIRYYRCVGPLSPANTSFGKDFCLAGGGNTLANALTQLSTYNIGTRYHADVVPILLGTNDIGVSGLTNAQILAAYDDLLDELATRLPGALLVAQKLLPRTDSGGIYQAQIADWNANYHDAMVAAAVARGVRVQSDSTFLDLYNASGITFLDGLHPDAASGAAMGDAMELRTRTWAGV